MGFLAPTVFALGAALLVGVLATYLLRPRRPLRRVSSTFLWLAALHDVEAQRPWRRVPPSLLLLLQIAALAAIIGALARPYVMTTQATGPFTIVLLDGSASMQATDVQPSRFDAARARVAQLIGALEPGQQIALVSLDAHPHVLAAPTSDAGALEQALQADGPSAQVADLQAALSVAGTLAEPHADAQVVIVGDGSLDKSQVPASFGLPIRYEGVGSQSASNLAVAGLTTRETDGQLSALARIVDNGVQAATASLTLRVDGNIFDTRSVSVDAGGVAAVQWDNLPTAAHTLQASLNQSDSLALDNAAWAVLPGDRPTRVLLVSDGNVFVERALGLRSGTQVTRVSPADYTPQPNQAFDLVVLDGFVPPGLPAGSGILLLHPPLNNGLVSVGSDVGVSAVSTTREDDPLLTDVPLGGVHITSARRVTAPNWADTILTSPETPLLMVGQQGGRRVGVLSFDIHSSDFPLQPGFPVLMQHVLDWLVPPASIATPVVQVGESVSLAPLPETVSLDVISPGGQDVQVAPPFPPPAFTGTETPGLYQVVQRDASGHQTTSAFAVNFANPTESQVKPGADSGAPSVGPTHEPLKAPHEFWEALTVVALLLLGLEAALAWWQFLARTGRARLALALRLGLAALLLMALFGVSLPQVVNRQATVFVDDVSASAQQAQPLASGFIDQALAARHADDAFAVVTAARGASVDRGLSTVTSTDPIQPQPTQPTDATDLAAGLRLGADLLPANYRSRIVLLSDGQETTGDAVAEARALHARGVQVDVVPLPATTSPEVLVDSVSTPSNVTQGEHFTIGVRLVSNVATNGVVRVYVNDRQIAEQAVSLSAGNTELNFGADAPLNGLLDVRAAIEADEDTLTQNNEARSIVEVQSPPEVLIVEQRPGEGDALASALQSTGVHVDRIAVADMPDQVDALGGYSSIVLADVSATSLSDAQQTGLRSYVRDLGRGLVAVGGDTSFGQGDYIGTPLDDVLPVRSSVRSHTDQGRVALLLVLDTSGSMADDPYKEGTSKLEMAKQAAILSAQQLSPRDTVGILTFDSMQHWTMPLTSILGMSTTAVQDHLAPLYADGGTDIYPAVSAGFNALQGVDAQYKHIILMTDGMSCCGGDYGGLEDRMRAANITLSTIAIGGDADTDLLSQLAKQGDGRYYFADHARDIPLLMTRETQLATRGPLVEGDVTPRLVSPDPALAALAENGLPHLGGYLVTSPKDLAEILLVSDAGDPLLARWQYGLGRAVAWTSDLRGRWSQDWLQWPGTQQLLSSMVSWTIAPAQGPLRLSLRSDGVTAYVTAEETTPAGSPGQVRAHIAQPGGADLEVGLSPTAPGEYTGAFPLTGPGAYIVHVDDQRDGAAVGSAEAGLPVSYPAEYRQVSADPRRLQQIASAGGGHVLAAPADAFASDLTPVTTPLPLQRLLLLVAAIVLPLEVGLRRLRVSPMDILHWLRHPRRVDVGLAGWSADHSIPYPAWLPGVWKPHPAPAPVVWPARPDERSLGRHATPGLARDSTAEATAGDEDDALGATLRWLAARRGGSQGDRG
jgi:Mg-chelatase subunit ChlD